MKLTRVMHGFVGAADRRRHVPSHKLAKPAAGRVRTTVKGELVGEICRTRPFDVKASQSVVSRLVWCSASCCAWYAYVESLWLSSTGLCGTLSHSST